jgi:excisionase family DNA binding protein
MSGGAVDSLSDTFGASTSTSGIERHYTTRELAELLSVHQETIRREAARGRLRSVRVGSDRRYSESAVRAWLNERAA